MATIVRVKRRRDADPLEVLHLAAKKQRQAAQEPQAASSSGSGNLFKLAGTVTTKDSGVSQKVREAIRKEKLEKEYKRHQANILGDVHERNREETRQSSVQNRFTVTAKHRAIALDNLDEVFKDGTGENGANENGETCSEVDRNNITKVTKDTPDADVCKLCGKKIRLEQGDTNDGRCTCQTDRKKHAAAETSGSAKQVKAKSTETKSAKKDLNNENVQKESNQTKDNVNENANESKNDDSGVNENAVGSACNGAQHHYKKSPLHFPGTKTLNATDPNMNKNENSVGGLCNGARSKDTVSASSSSNGARSKDTVTTGSSNTGARNKDSTTAGSSSNGARRKDTPTAGSSGNGACGGSSREVGGGDGATGKDKDGMFCLVDLEVERGPTYDSPQMRDSWQDQITCNGQAMAREVVSENRDDSDYVYDIYYTNDRNFDFQMFESDLTFEALGNRDEGWRQELVDDEFVYEDEDEDENAESNWRNDYPEQDPGFLDNQAMDYVYPEDMAHIGGFETEDTNHLADWMSWRCNLEDGAELSSDDNEADIYEAPGSATEAYYKRVKKEMEADSDAD